MTKKMTVREARKTLAIGSEIATPTHGQAFWVLT